MNNYYTFEDETRVTDTSTEYEYTHLEKTLSIISRNVVDYEKQSTDLRADIDDLQAHFHDDNPELWQTLENTITLYENVYSSLQKNLRAKKKPYFGRIIFEDCNSDDKRLESLYIGRAGVNADVTHQVVIDWRAPLANVYYENGIGKCTYTPPAGNDITLDLKLKRTFDIDQGKLNGFFDSSVAANDELLNKYLAKNKQAVLGEIIATIQKEQNDIIRKSPLHNVIAQGAAGSGKTTVAMHRISYILYNYPEKIKPSDFYIIGSNEMLLNYITGVLPELDVQGFRQMTMEQLFVRLLYESWDSYKYAVKETSVLDETTAMRSSSEWFYKLDDYLRQYEEKYVLDVLRQQAGSHIDGIVDVVLEPLKYVEGIEGGKTGVYDRRESSDRKYDPHGLKSAAVPLLKGAYISRFLEENPTMSLQNKINTLNERLWDNLEQELLIKDIKYTAKEKTAIKRDYRNYFGTKDYKITPYKIYEDFLRANKCNSLERSKQQAKAEELKTGNRTRIGLDVYDLAALAYIYKRVHEQDIISEAHHIVIDEAQDYGMMAYRALVSCIKDCTYTVMGDISQNIRYESGLNDWSELRELLLTTPKDSFCTLRKSYRNTVEISNFATNILDHGDFEVYPVEPIIRHGTKPVLKKINDDNEIDTIVSLCKGWQEKELSTIAIICKNQEQSDELAFNLKKKLDIIECSAEHAEFAQGVMVLPVSLTKGLEFDAVILYDPSVFSYPSDDRNAKLLYVAATRALHELAVIYKAELTRLISEPVPENKKRRVVADTTDISKAENELPQHIKELNASYSDEKEQEYVKRLIMKSASKKTVNKYGVGKIEDADHITPELPVRNSVNVIDDYKNNAFAQLTDSSAFSMPGHAAPPLAIKWVSRQANGIFLQSRFGVLRIFPISAGMVRVSFAKGMNFNLPADSVTKQFNMLKNYQYREKGNIIEIILPKLIVSVDKLTGVIIYKNGKGKELIREKNPEPRYIDDSSRSINHFVINSSEAFHAYNGSADMKYVRGESYCINPDSGKPPYVIVKDKFGILPATVNNTYFMHKPGIGTALMTEDNWQDIYFVSADSTEELINVYNKLIN